MILKDGECHKILHGGEVGTTIGIVEMRAIIESLEYIQTTEDVSACRIDVYCDRQDVVYSAIGKYQRRSNKDEWRRYDRASKSLDLTIHHVPRNSVDEQALTDELSGLVREKLEKNPKLSPIHYRNIKS